MKNCIICGGKLKPFFCFRNYPLFLGIMTDEIEKLNGSFDLSLDYCAKCEHIQNTSILPDEKQKIWYEQEYYSAPYPSVSGLGKEEIDFFYDFVKQNIKFNSGNVFEIGCFDGYLLQLFKNNGFKVSGCEPNNFAASIAEKNTDVFINKKYFDGADYKNKKFNLIILRNILEHINNPLNIIKDLYSLLKKNGRLAIEIPNAANIISKFEIGSFHHEHISYFTINSICQTAKACGFAVEKLIVNSSIICILKKQNSDKINFQFDNIDFLKLIEAYKERIDLQKTKINILLRRYKKIGILGGGGHTTGLCNLLISSNIKKIKYVYDNDSMKFNNKISGLNIKVSPSKLIGIHNPDAIIISSYIYQEQLKKQALSMNLHNTDIILLYPEIALI